MTRSYPAPPAPATALLQLARLKAGISQAELGRRAGLPATMISAYERGRRQPTLPTLMRLIRAAGFELRLNLVPHDSHDDTLAGLESGRSLLQRAHRGRQMQAWRDAVVLDSVAASRAAKPYAPSQRRRVI